MRQMRWICHDEATLDAFFSAAKDGKRHELKSQEVTFSSKTNKIHAKIDYDELKKKRHQNDFGMEKELPTALACANSISAFIFLFDEQKTDSSAR